jgi:hypothetical protein
LGSQQLCRQGTMTQSTCQGQHQSTACKLTVIQDQHALFFVVW